MDKLLNKLFELFAYTWVLHWKESGPANIGVHKTLDDLYTDLKSFIDELAETSLSTGSKVSDLLTFSANIDSEPSLEALNKKLSALREEILDIQEGKESDYYSDLLGRIVASLNHYIFMLSLRPSSLTVFSDKKESRIVAQLRRLFKSQNEFLVRFNSYLKSHTDGNPEVEDFFKSHEPALIDLQSDIYKSNTKLFSLRGDVELLDDEDATRSYNKLVQFFDLFID